MIDGMHYWDFPEGSDTYIWLRQIAMNPWYEEEQRILREYLETFKDPPEDFVPQCTNTWKEDNAQYMRELREEMARARTDRIRQLRVEMADLSAHCLAGFFSDSDDDDSDDNTTMSGTSKAPADHPVLQRQLNNDVKADISADTADDDECAFAIRLCMSF